MKNVCKKNWLIEIRNLKNLTQNEVADLAGISRVAYTNIENGRRIPSVKTAKKIAEVLNFDWKDFFL